MGSRPFGSHELYHLNKKKKKTISNSSTRHRTLRHQHLFPLFLLHFSYEHKNSITIKKAFLFSIIPQPSCCLNSTTQQEKLLAGNHQLSITPSSLITIFSKLYNHHHICLPFLIYLSSTSPVTEKPSPELLLTLTHSQEYVHQSQKFTDLIIDLKTYHHHSQVIH